MGIVLLFLTWGWR